jgi:acetyltransferase-like isoleucine patch superfamily enzyme/coenzyme F420-reducing hydrogenase beta subunit
MIDIKNEIECCGCNACGDICPKDAITYKTNIEGFWYPEVNMVKCIDCHLCEKVCPIINIKDLKKNDYEKPICYVAENKNIEVVFDSTSGGLFSALANHMYRDGGYVGGAIFNEDFSVLQFISADKADLEKLRSSKYLQSHFDGFYKKVKDLVVKGEKVLVCGSPCQMAAMRAFLKKDYENLIIVDYVCRGINSPKVWKKYIDSFEERYGSKVVYAKAKSKEYGWHSLTQKVILKDGRHIYEPVSINNFTKGYLSTGAYCRPSCYDCQFKGLPRMADLTLADFWGINGFNKVINKDLGLSLVMLNSNKGVAYFEHIKKSINYWPLTFEQASANNPSLFHSLDAPKINRNEFFHDLDLMPFTEIATKYINIPPQKNLRRQLSQGYHFIEKILKYGKHTLIHPFDFLRLIKHNSIINIIKGNVLCVLSNCTVDISSKSRIEILGKFTFGTKRIKGSKHESRLLVEEGAKLKVNGKWNVFYGADIELFKGATLEIGKTSNNDSGANLDLTIVCADNISIGENVQIGRHVTIRDNNGGHYINLRGYKDNNPVKIGDKVWLCESCTIMPGARIGDGAIIGAHSVVYGDIPAHSLVSGNPAQVVEENVLWLY